MKKNIFANYVGAFVLALAPMLALPWYLMALGPKQFGLVGFITMLQGLLGLADAGMSQALIREIAIQFGAGADGRRKAASLLSSFEIIYWVLGGAVAVMLLLFRGPIVKYWLVLDGLPSEAGQQAILGAAALFAAQFPGSIYRSFMLGAQAQVRLNKIMVGGATLRHIGGVVVMALWQTLSTYLLWNVIVSLVETMVRAIFAWETTGLSRRGSGWDASQMRSLWRMALGMSGATFLGAITVQMDKVIVSKMVGVDQFGYYMIAATVASGVLQLIYPLIQAALPHAIQLREDPKGLIRLNIRLLKIIGTIVICGIVSYATLGGWMLKIWLKNIDAVDSVYPVLSILLIGSAMNAFYNVGYIQWIVFEKLGRVFQVNFIAFVLSISIIPLFVIKFGMVGAASGWLAINLIGLVLSLEWIGRLGGASNI
jgi:O-antigen/teichoic acid export membrane protein